MSELKYKVGDKVRIKSIDWYNENKDDDGDVTLTDVVFYKRMARFCGDIKEIENFNGKLFKLKNDLFFDYWTDEMIEGLVEEPVLSAPNITECVFIHEKDMKRTTEYILPDGYIFKDENGNEILTSKIILEKKKKEYPKTYEECAILLDRAAVRNNLGYKGELLLAFQKLLVCRDAYWKIAGEEMGLGKPWEPDLTDNVTKHCIEFRDCGVCKVTYSYTSRIFTFPTEEMRDVFYDNFKEEIEKCKELL